MNTIKCITSKFMQMYDYKYGYSHGYVMYPKCYSCNKPLYGIYIFYGLCAPCMHSIYAK